MDKQVSVLQTELRARLATRGRVNADTAAFHFFADCVDMSVEISPVRTEPEQLSFHTRGALCARGLLGGEYQRERCGAPSFFGSWVILL